MTQYCRYCCYCFTANGNWCEAKEKTLTDAQIKRTNHCKLFEFTPMDAYDWHNEYKPRKKKPKQKPLEYFEVIE